MSFQQTYENICCIIRDKSKSFVANLNSSNAYITIKKNCTLKFEFEFESDIIKTSFVRQDKTWVTSHTALTISLVSLFSKVISNTDGHIFTNFLFWLSYRQNNGFHDESNESSVPSDWPVSICRPVPDTLCLGNWFCLSFIPDPHWGGTDQLCQSPGEGGPVWRLRGRPQDPADPQWVPPPPLSPSRQWAELWARLQICLPYLLLTYSNSGPLILQQMWAEEKTLQTFCFHTQTLSHLSWAPIRSPQQ